MDFEVWYNFKDEILKVKDAIMHLVEIAPDDKWADRASKCLDPIQDLRLDVSDAISMLKKDSVNSGCHGKSKKKGKKAVKSAYDYDDFVEIYPYSEDADPHSDEDLALSYVIEVYGDEFVNLDDNTLKEMRDTLEQYFDNGAYVRDWNIMNPDYQIESIEEVGSVEDLEINDLARYFDYDDYGRTIRLGDGYYWNDDKNCWTNSTENLDQSRKTIKSLSSGCHGKSKKNKKQLKSSFEDAVQDGYNDYLEGRYENPYDPDEEPDEYEGWEKGYERARRKESDHIGGGY